MSGRLIGGPHEQNKKVERVERLMSKPRRLSTRLWEISVFPLTLLIMDVRLIVIHPSGSGCGGTGGWQSQTSSKC